MLTYYKSGTQIDYTNAGSAISAGDVVTSGDILGIAVNAIAASTGVGPLQISGIVKVTKTGSQAWTIGQPIYYSGSNTFTSASAGNTFAGLAALAVGSGAGETTGYLLLKGVAPTATALQLTSPNIATSIDDVNGNELFKLTATASAVNEITVANAATGSGPALTATGGDTNVPVTLAQKGAADVILGAATCTGLKLAASQPVTDANGNELLKFTAASTAVNEITVANAATGSSPSLTASGGDTNIGITLTPKGTGAITLDTKAAIGTSSAATIGFYGTTPASQAANVVALGLEGATQATTTEVRAISVAVDAILAAVKTVGLVASA